MPLVYLAEGGQESRYVGLGRRGGRGGAAPRVLRERSHGSRGPAKLSLGLRNEGGRPRRPRSALWFGAAGGRYRATHIVFMKILIFAFLCAAACSTSVSRVVPQRCPPGGIDPATLIPAADQPKAAELFIPPLPIPTGVRGSRSIIRVVVETLGHVIPDSVLVCGIADDRYSHRVAEAAAALQSRPRRVAGRPVIAPALLVYDL